MSWYVLQAFVGQENKVEKYIQILMASELEGIVNDVKVPAEDIVEMRAGKRRNVSKKFLPGYVLIDMSMPEQEWRATCSVLRGIQGVSGFVGYPGNVKPQPIPQEEVRAILQRSGDLKSEKKFIIRHDFSVGEEVRIIDGPFDTFTGAVDEINYDRNKLRVMVGIFGRVTPVELDFSQIEKI